MTKINFLNWNQFRIGVLTLVFLAVVQIPGAFCDWDRNASSFKVYTGISAGVTRENMRASINQVGTDSSVTGTYSGYGYSYPQGQQAVSNLNNVIQITETYEIVLNGDANSVVTNGTVLNSDQDSTDSDQTGDNGITE